jgi:hypothetical protein
MQNYNYLIINSFSSSMEYDVVTYFQGFRSSPTPPNLPVTSHHLVRQVEAKYPAFLFKQQLTALVEKIYGTIRDNLKKQELASLLSLCIQVRTSNFICQLYLTKTLWLSYLHEGG